MKQLEKCLQKLLNSTLIEKLQQDSITIISTKWLQSKATFDQHKQENLHPVPVHWIFTRLVRLVGQ